METITLLFLKNFLKIIMCNKLLFIKSNSNGNGYFYKVTFPIQNIM